MNIFICIYLYVSAKEISVLEKVFGFAPTPYHINEADLRRNLEDFSRKMKCKWHFRNEAPQSNEEISQLRLSRSGILLKVILL